MRDLPKWCFPITLPAVHDLQSGTALEMVSTVYGAVKDLIAEYNQFVENLTKEIADFKGVNTTEIQNFVNGIETNISNKFQALDQKFASLRTELLRELNNKNPSGSGTTDISEGFTMTDRASGIRYSVYMENGEMVIERM